VCTCHIYTDRQRDRQAGRQADRQIDTYIHAYIHTHTHTGSEREGRMERGSGREGEGGRAEERDFVRWWRGEAGDYPSSPWMDRGIGRCHLSSRWVVVVRCFIEAALELCVHVMV